MITMFKKNDCIDIKIPDWLAEKKGSDTSHLEGKVKVKTDRAILLETSDGGEMWLPLSQITVIKEKVEETEDEFAPTEDDVPF